MQSNAGFARMRPHFEGLEHRCLLASIQSVALVGPVLEGMHVLDLTAEPMAAGRLYGATNALTKSIASAAAAVVANALAPFNVKLDAMKQTLAAAPLETSAQADKDALVLPLPTPGGDISRFK